MRKIVIDPRVIKHLGRDLITSPEVAIIEFLKNSSTSFATLRPKRHHPPCAGVSDKPDGASAAGCAGAWQAARREHRQEKLHL